MVYFIADTHFGHENIIKLCSRPFSLLKEMDEELIARWNARVNGGDTVYILGDILWETCNPEDFLPRLNGKKILIAGNHDKKWLKKYGGQFFEEVTFFKEIRLDGKDITLCHYPLVEWDGCRKEGSKKLGWHIYGHIHNNYLPEYRNLFLSSHALNAGADITDFAPAAFEELVEFNRAHKLRCLNTLYDKALFLARDYHKYQRDKAGAPYINHPLAVSRALSDEKCKIVALLHDLLEDTDIDFCLLEQTFPRDIVEAVAAMTHMEGEGYFDYIRRAAANPIARQVKLADLAHNMDRTRFKALPEGYERSYQKYLAAKNIILYEFSPGGNAGGSAGESPGSTDGADGDGLV